MLDSPDADTTDALACLDQRNSTVDELPGNAAVAVVAVDYLIARNIIAGVVGEHDDGPVKLFFLADRAIVAFILGDHDRVFFPASKTCE